MTVVLTVLEFLSGGTLPESALTAKENYSRPYAGKNDRERGRKTFISTLIECLREIVPAQAGNTQERSQLDVLEDGELPFCNLVQNGHIFFYSGSNIANRLTHLGRHLALGYHINYVSRRPDGLEGNSSPE